MATFANQAPNLSALQSKFDLLLKVRGSDKETESCTHNIGTKNQEQTMFDL